MAIQQVDQQSELRRDNMAATRDPLTARQSRLLQEHEDRPGPYQILPPKARNLAAAEAACPYVLAVSQLVQIATAA